MTSSVWKDDNEGASPFCGKGRSSMVVSQDYREKGENLPMPSVHCGVSNMSSRHYHATAVLLLIAKQVNCTKQHLFIKFIYPQNNCTTRNEMHQVLPHRSKRRMPAPFMDLS
jgi:hypothetical protein